MSADSEVGTKDFFRVTKFLTKDAPEFSLDCENSALVLGF